MVRVLSFLFFFFFVVLACQKVKFFYSLVDPVKPIVGRFEGGDADFSGGTLKFGLAEFAAKRKKGSERRESDFWLMGVGLILFGCFGEGIEYLKFVENGCPSFLEELGELGVLGTGRGCLKLFVLFPDLPEAEFPKLVKAFQFFRVIVLLFLSMPLGGGEDSGMIGGGDSVQKRDAFPEIFEGLFFFVCPLESVSGN